MPYLKADAPLNTPEAETLESLLGKKNYHNTRLKRIKTIQDLTDAERNRSGLVTIGKRCITIPGDPFGVYPSWAGNVAHPEDERMLDILPPIFETLIQGEIIQSDQLNAIEHLLSRVPTTGVNQLAAEISNGNEYDVVKDTAEESVVDFKMGSLSVRLMNATDIDIRALSPYNHTLRARMSVSGANDVFNEPHMSTSLQQYMMACILRDGTGQLNERDSYDEAEDDVDLENPGSKAFEKLRARAQERFWLHMTPEQRQRLHYESLQSNPQLEDILMIIKTNWDRSWNDKEDIDYFRQYAKDAKAAEHVWDLVDKDVFVVTDKNNQVVFANVEHAADLMFGTDVVDNLVRALDLWSYFTPLPLPETQRHVVDRWVRHLHPELDLHKAPVDRLPQAKMAVAHLGCWSHLFDPNGKIVIRTRDARFARSVNQEYSQILFPQFAKAVLGKATSITRLLVQNLDPEYYAECLEIFNHLPEGERVVTDDEDFASLFVLLVNAYTQRHRDRTDVKGGLAGLVTLGDYTGGNLCVPQLGIKVPYKPGACAVIRGDKLDHLVTDYRPPRYGIVVTNHESTKRHALRKMGRVPQQAIIDEGEPFDRPDRLMSTTCVNKRSDDDDDDEIHWTNKELHGPRALDSSSESG